MPLPTIDESDTEMLISKSDSHNSRPWTELQPISSSGEHEDQLLDDDIEQGQTNRLSRDESGHDGIEDVAFAEEEVSSTSDTDFSDGEVTVAGDFSLEEQDEHRQQQHKKNRHNNRPLRSSISNGINGHRQGRTTNDRVRQSNDPRSYENMTDGYHKHRRLLCYTTVIIFFAACVTTLGTLVLL